MAITECVITKSAEEQQYLDGVANARAKRVLDAARHNKSAFGSLADWVLDQAAQDGVELTNVEDLV